MVENPALLSAVLGDPDNDQPRLAYAAWWQVQPDSQAQARAVFTRLQIHLVNRGTRPQDLAYQEQELLEQNKSAWMAPFADLSADVGFDRGFVEYVAMPAATFLQNADRLFALAPIRHLKLTGLESMISQLIASPAMASIRSLDLTDAGLTDDHLKALAGSRHLSNLRWLGLGYNQIGFDGVDALATSRYLKALRYADFQNNPCQPGEQYARDDHRVVDTWLPEDGVLLERRHGHLPWLHINAETVFDVVPNRFRIAV